MTTMRKRPQARHISAVTDDFVWTGRIDFELVDQDGWRFGRVELIVRLDVVCIWWGSKNLGALDRETLRAWLRQPMEPLARDDVRLHWRGGGLFLQIHAGPLHAVPAAALAQLRGTL
jgi:hypothetical protein